MEKLVATMLAAAALLGFAGPSRADPIVELGLAIDVSGSISPSNFDLQKNAYINVLNNASIIPRDGSVAIGIIAFGNIVHPVYTTTVITNATIAGLISAIQTNLQDYGGGTAIGTAITYLTTQLTTNAINSTKQVIDVSTDGDGNAGINQVTAANSAITAGIEQVNCLGIGASANCNFARGADSFSETVTTFADFQTSLERKIVRETTVPEPASLALLGLGLAALGVARRRLV